MATKQEFAKFMVTLGAAIPRYAPNTGDPNVLEVWYSAIGRLEVNFLESVFQQCIRRFDQFPSIREILELAGETPQHDEDKARDVAENIWTTLVKHGSQKFDLARDLGPIGAAVVRRQGGWKAICETATYDNATTLKAQWRQLAEVLIRKSRRGDVDDQPCFDVLDMYGENGETGSLQISAEDEMWELP